MESDQGESEEGLGELDEFDEDDEMCAFPFFVSLIFCYAEKRDYYQAR